MVRAMRIQFCGANRTVTGSSHLIEAGGVRALLDCGMYQGSRQRARELNEWLPQDPHTLDAVILSHGHLDHCGKLPVLTQAGYSGPIYCTPATREVARIVLLDAAEIQEENADYLNIHTRGPGEEPVKPLYQRVDAHDVLKLLQRVPYRRTTHIQPRDGKGKGIAFTFFDAGHILGSAYVILQFEEAGEPKKLLFTADIGRFHTPIMRDPDPLPGAVDYVITESTYGNRSHAQIAEVEPQLLSALRHCIERRSRLLIPSFAIGRTQTVLWYVQKLAAEGAIPPIHVYVDSPMAIEATRTYQDFPDDYDQQTRQLLGSKDLFGLSHVTLASSVEQSRQINKDRGPCVIIASSPTCEFGRILHHIIKSIDRADDLLLFVGWIPPRTLGRRLQEGERRVKILDRWWDVRLQARTIHGLSAHADADELLEFLKPTLVPSTRAFVVHGEQEQAEMFARKLIYGGIGEVSVPAMESSVITGTDDLPPPPTKQQWR
jgi:metallo-beta-lactamase family protein